MTYPLIPPACLLCLRHAGPPVLALAAFKC